MNIARNIREYIDQDSGRRLVSVSFDEGGEVRSVVMPFDLLADDLLGFLADAARLYPEEILSTEGFRKLEGLILLRNQATPG